ncbi:MAG: hypothetical protein Q4C20_08615 [Erysipelotrichaceae bacterium]|nr:hypothetical protein [Erysipelotrichaceae bacterium]
MKGVRCILVLFLLVSFIHSDSLLVYAEDSGISTDFEEENRLLYSSGGTWIQAADGRWWYQHSDGSYTTSDWEYINGKWYYFDSEGWMVTGWIQLSGIWYYLKPESGEMVTNWQLIGGYWYYFNDSGAMQTGWLHDSNTNKDYYLNSSGQMVTGWQYLVRSNCYKKDSYGNDIAYYHYFDNSGMLVTDSDTPGCVHGFNTFEDHINLKGRTINYYINPSCSFTSQINSATNHWNLSVSLTRIYSSIPTADLLFYDFSNDQFYGKTYFYYNSSENVVLPTNSDWHYCRIALNPVNDKPLATVAHEIGHAFGLSHCVTNTDSIMHYDHDRRNVSRAQTCDFSVINHLY